MNKNKMYLLLACLAFAGLNTQNVSSQSKQKPNVLLIISDDLRNELGVYGAPYIKTPNIDKLASEGVSFERAYVQQAVCAASRASFLTGCRPNTTGADYPYSEYFVNEFLPNHQTISEHFYKNGYYAQNFGKVHHGNDLDKLSAPHYKAPTKYKGQMSPYVEAASIEQIKAKGQIGRPAVEWADVEDEAYEDGKTAAEVVKVLEDLKDNEEPFFLAVGFYKPHLPFNAPKKYWDLYNRDSIPLAPNKELHKGVTNIVIDNYALKKYAGEAPDYDHVVSNERARELKHGYLACVSYVDAQVGKILQKLEETGQRDNTIILFISDHGWHLGEQGMWGKTTNFENSALAPLIMSTPSGEKGKKSKALVEYVDIYPTLIEAANAGSLPSYLEGTSFLPLMTQPNMPWKKAAFSQFPRGMLAQKEGYSIRTDKFRYTEWWDNEHDKLLLTELYDHQKDPIESVNVAELPEYKEVVKTHHQMLVDGWKASLPEGVTNLSNNVLAPRSVGWGGEGKSRKDEWENYLKQMAKEGKEPVIYFKRY